MSTTLLQSRDVGFRTVVMRQLEWDPEVDASAIGVAVNNGVVTLTGFIDTYHGKLAAERAAKRVTGVRAVANDLQVLLRLERTDADIAADAVRAIDLRSSVPPNVQIAVHAGHISLTGTVAWLYQRYEAEKAVRHIKGVKGVANYIHVLPTDTRKNVKRLIVSAMHRAADVDARQITVTLQGTTVVLTGCVSSWPEFEGAERAARQAPGITGVDNLLEIVPPPFDFNEDDELC